MGRPTPLHRVQPTRVNRTMPLGRLSPEKTTELVSWVADLARFEWASGTPSTIAHPGIQDCATGLTDSFHATWTAPDGTVTEQKISWREDCQHFAWNRAFVESDRAARILDALTTLESLR